MSPDLHGLTVGVTADRRGEDQAVLFRRLGAEVLVGPVLRTLSTAADGRLRTRTEALLADPPGFVIANTGFGMRSWFAFADGWGRRDELLGMLRASRVAARGPKAVGALRSAQVPVWWQAPNEQLATVVDHLVEHGVEGSRVALQLDGNDRPELVERLEAAGASVIELPLYRWDQPDDDRAERLVRAIVAGGVQAVTFTSAPAVRNLVELADELDVGRELRAALNERVVVGCVGPVCAAAAHEEGLLHTVVPEHWRLGSLVKAVAAELTTRQSR